MAAEPWAPIAAANAQIHRTHMVFQLIAAALWVIAAGTMGGVIIAAVVANYAADQPEKLISVLLSPFSAVVLGAITLAGATEIEQESRGRLCGPTRDTRGKRGYDGRCCGWRSDMSGSNSP